MIFFALNILVLKDIRKRKWLNVLVTKSSQNEGLLVYSEHSESNQFLAEFHLFVRCNKTQ